MTAAVDLAVVGGGPGGYAAALRAAVRGLRVTVVEADRLGGTCLHRGCVPSKALLHVAAVLDTVAGAAHVGVAAEVRGVDRERAVAVRDDVVEAMHSGLVGLLRRRGVRVVAGRAEVADDHATVVVGGERIRARAVVVATGSAPAVPACLPVDGRVVITSDTATALPRIPRRAVVVGSGAVGLEFASLYRSLGAEVTLVEALGRLAPREDEAVSALLERAFRRRGITTCTNASAVTARVAGERARVRIDSAAGTDEVDADTVLVATGRRASGAAAGAPVAALADARGALSVDAAGRVAGGGGELFAVGDVTAGELPMLAHAAFAQGFVVADTVAGEAAAPVIAERVPRVTYCSPEVASVGLTEAQARERGLEPRVASVPLAASARGRIEGGEGLVKVVAAPAGDILGIHMVGPHATERIAEAQLITGWEARAGEVAAMVHPHPTIAEALGEAHLALAGLPFHVH